MRKLVYKESEEFQMFIEPFLIELNRIYLVETKRIFKEKRDYFFVKDSLLFRINFISSAQVWKSVFKRQGVRQLDDVEAIVQNVARLQPKNFFNLVQLRHFYNYLDYLFKKEQNEHLMKKFDDEFLMENNKFPHKSKKKSQLQGTFTAIDINNQKIFGILKQKTILIQKKGSISTNFYKK